MKSIAKKIADSLHGKDRCHVMVVYENSETRDRATAACDFLMQTFWADTEFEFYWWKLEYLNAPELGERAALNAADADILFFSFNESPPRQEWLDRWLTHRGNRPGLMIQLTELASSQSAQEIAGSKFLQDRIAQASTLNFLIAGMQHAGFLSASEEETVSGGTEFTHGLGHSTSRDTPPSHSGLNE